MNELNTRTPREQIDTFAQRRDITRHLVIVHRDGWQALSDWTAIGERIRALAPSIGVIVASDDEADERLSEIAAQRPTLVFSAGRIRKFAVRRGRIYQGRSIEKLEQVELFVKARVPVPLTALLLPGTDLSPRIWGPFVILKPSDLASSSHGQGVQLMRTERVRFIAPQDYPEGHPGRRAPMIIQQFIDTGPHFGIYRVTTLFGEPLYCYRIKSGSPRPPLEADDEVIEQSVIATQGLDEAEREFVYEADVMALARAAHEAMPDVPLKGCDIMRDARTGRLFVLEVNPGGNTWHFSSQHLAAIRAKYGKPWTDLLYTQLDAMGTAALVLAERTLKEAQ